MQITSADSAIERKAPEGKFRVISAATIHEKENTEDLLIDDFNTVQEAFTVCTTHNFGNDLTRCYYCFDDQGDQPGNHP